MNTKLRFKVIAILISVSLAGLLVSQGYWLNGLYDTTKQQVDDNIQEALRMADYKELFIRINTLNKNAFHTEINQQISFKNEEEEGSILDTLSIKTNEDSLKKDSTTESLNKYLSLLTELEGLLQVVLHQKIDSVMPINYAVYDSVLTVELQQRNIFVPHQLKVIQLIDSVPQAYMILGDTCHSFEADNSWKDATQYDYPIQTNPEQYYSLLLKSSGQLVFRQMEGILVSSFLLIVVILLAFVYLLYTILRQKTIEELKTDFTNNMTHELKTPLSVAYAANDVLLNYEASVSSKQQKYLTIVREQLIHLSGLVEQILTLSAENRSTFRLKQETIQVADILPALIEQHKLKAKKTVAFVTEIPENFAVFSDRTHFYNMLGNLIENAIKYSGDTSPCRIVIKAMQLPDEVCLTVSDNGIGISQANLQHIFEKFYRVSNGNLHNVKGYGLGLYYVKDMMYKHGGSVSVKSQLGKGTTFTLHFKSQKKWIR